MAAQTPILIVDDDPIFLDGLATRLRAAGYGAVTARTVGEALELCQRLRVDLVVADWIMPQMDGVELCRTLKRDPTLRQIYFIVLTARGAVTDKVQALDSGVDEYLVEPCAEEELLARIRAGLRMHRLQEELALLEWRLATREIAVALGHAINNPLAAMANYLELLEQRIRPGTGESVNDLLAGARQQVDRMGGVIRRLLNLREPRKIPTSLGVIMTDLESGA